MTDALAIVRACSCSAQYDAEGWAALPLVGRTRLAGKRLELRNCVKCGSTLTIERVPKARKPANIITTSAARCYRSCPRKYLWRYVRGLRPRVDADALRFGTLTHSCLASWWLNRGNSWTMPPDNADAFDAARVRALMFGYESRWTMEGFEVESIEQSFEIPLCRGWHLSGKRDGVVRKDGKRLVLEHKTSSVDIGPGSDYMGRLALDTQCSLYMAEGGFDGVIYDVLRKVSIKPGVVPTLDAEGQKVVTDANGERVKTAKGEWRQTGDSAKGYTLQTREETVAEYESRCVEAIAGDPDGHYQRAEVVRLDGELDEARADLIGTVRAIEQCAKADRWPRNDDACFTYGSRCQYWALCTHTGSEADYATADDPHPELKENA